MKVYDEAKEVVGRVFATSSRTKLLLTIAGVSLVEAAPVDPVLKVQWQTILICAFTLAQGFAEGVSKKYAPKK